ncbi:ABC transporter substrate-binding protein [Cohnella sp. 56]|uniref:ABC transporter substrate-binding protein n=1 Tax=Cohnella sp. 56 TaxID=3113722 RepID=UPI0030E7B052
MLTGFLLCAGCLIAAMIFWSGSPPSQGRENGESTSMNVWLYDEELMPFLERYEKQNPGLNLNIRSFRSWNALYEELLKAISANAAPHIAEIGSTYGVAQLVQRGIVRPVDPATAAYADRIGEPFTAAFSYDGQQWAVPIGGSVPVVYSNRNLFHTANAGQPPADWAAIKRAGGKIVKDVDQDGKTDIWGLVADPSMAWVHMNAAYDAGTGSWDSERLLGSFGRWRDYVDVSRMTPPLQHELAESQFIYGKAGMLISSSQKRAVLEKYIGGKFDFDIAALPQDERDGGLLLDARGFAVMTSDAREEALSRQAIRYLLDEQVQTELLHAASLIPARADIADSLLRSGDLTERETAVMQIAERLAVKPAEADDERRWRSYTDEQEKLETYPDSSVDIGL